MTVAGITPYMPHERTRRRILGTLGTVTVATLGGCTNVVDRASNDDGTTATGGTRRPTAASTTTRTDRPERTSTADETTTGESDGWSTESVTVEPPEVSYAGVPVPDGESQYARMGHDDASVTATLYGNWKCPYTREFVLTDLPTVVERYVEPGQVALEFRAVAYRSGEPFLGPDAPRAARAGLAVWDVDPASFWSYFSYVFGNQPQERYEWAQPSLLLRFAESSGVSSRRTVRQRLTNGSYDDPVRRTVTAAAERGVWSVPRVAVDGRVTAPTVDFEETLSQLDEAVQN
ncbi:DsbA family protein [Haloarchaeobius sp. HRN-SO-5]|uniref:DsbA family protein n=1 Tax=Haloarchaeobius sp. HRN-SO-5 TaxID=3446118 RepID=UPI003EBEC5FA